jgi:hypothetical protein
MANCASGRRLKKAPFSNTYLKGDVHLSLPTINPVRTSFDCWAIAMSLPGGGGLRMCFVGDF